jgi:transcription-repair coupling factor (superfamily II helicase)
MTVDLALEARRLNAIGDPLLYRIGVAGLIARHDRETVRQAFVREAARDGVVSIALAPDWRLPRRSLDRKVG